MTHRIFLSLTFLWAAIVSTNAAANELLFADNFNAPDSELDSSALGPDGISGSLVSAMFSVDGTVVDSIKNMI